MKNPSITSIIKEIKDKYQNHFESGYLYMIERKDIDKAINELLDKERKTINRVISSMKTFRDELTASYVLIFDFRGDYDISKRQQDAITAFLRTRGFKYHYDVGTYFI